MEILKVLPKDKNELKVIINFLNALKVSFEKEDISEREKAVNLYGENFVKKMEQGEEEIKAGKTRKIKPADIWNL